MAYKKSVEMNLTSIDELLGVSNEESAMDIPIYKIHSFREHPFKVLDDEKMEELVESIRLNGILTPVLLRPDGVDQYEMVSGHRRMHAATTAGLNSVPAIIREMSDEDAVIFMVDTNIQREELLPSEKAFAYKMRLNAMKIQGKRTDLTSGQNGQKGSKMATFGQNDQRLPGTVSRDLLAQQVGESSRQIQRYIRLTELLPDLLDMVDEKVLNFTIAVDISYFDKEIQKWVLEYINENGFIKQKQIQELKRYMEHDEISRAMFISIFNHAITSQKRECKITFSEKKLRKYFTEDYTSEQMEEIIEDLLMKWKEGKTV